MAEAKNSKTGLYVAIAAAVVIVAVIIGVVVANSGNKGGNEGDNGNGGTSQSTSSLTADDLSDVYGWVDIDEYDEMQKMAKSIQNGEMTGKVIQFDGYVAHPGTKYSVVENSADGTKKIGTEFVIVDGDESDYPEDGQRVFITGKIVEQEPMVFVIHTLKDFVKKM